MADQLGDGGKSRFLTVIDVFTREALAIEVGERLRGEDVALEPSVGSVGDSYDNAKGACVDGGVHGGFPDR